MYQNKSGKLFSAILAVLSMGAPLLIARTSAADVLSLPPIVHNSEDAYWSDIVAIPQFSPAMGTLTQVKVVLAWNSHQAVTITNSGGAGQSVPDYIAAKLHLEAAFTLPSTSVITCAPTDLNLGGFDSSGNMSSGVQIDPGQTISMGPCDSICNSLTVGSATINNSAGVIAFQGNKVVYCPLCAEATLKLAHQYTDITAIANAKMGITVYVTYTYTPAPGSSSHNRSHQY